jgi:sorbitol/mannitol transport system substrate-binding protein
VGTPEKDVLRQNVTIDISNGGGAYDVMIVGRYEVPIWGENRWLVPLDTGMAEDCDAAGLLRAISGGLAFDASCSL